LAARVRNVLFILCGTAVLVLKSRYTGPCRELVRSYLGNFSASFAVYFLCANVVLLARPFLPARLGRAAAAASAFAVVALFEATDGFHVMSNTYDPLDYAANAAGIACAVLADAATAKYLRGAGPHNHPSG
jgi:hypothetical protein